MHSQGLYPTAIIALVELHRSVNHCIISTTTTLPTASDTGPSTLVSPWTAEYINYDGRSLASQRGER
jgi:hypothetical protein